MGYSNPMAAGAHASAAPGARHSAASSFWMLARQLVMRLARPLSCSAVWLIHCVHVRTTSSRCSLQHTARCSLLSRP